MARGRQTRKAGRLRIIGGAWRGRRLTFPDATGLRPTGDRIRETLFNWLAPDIVGSRCLDLFAGSGALGIEALSRGAAHCDFVERQRQVASALVDNLALLGAGERGRVACRDAQEQLQDHAGRYTIVFLDPPFADQLLAPCAALLVERELLAPGALVYLEHAAGRAPTLPDSWQALRQKRSGDVAYALFSGNPAIDAG